MHHGYEGGRTKEYLGMQGVSVNSNLNTLAMIATDLRFCRFVECMEKVGKSARGEITLTK